MKNRVFYIHGKGGSAAESQHYKPLFPGSEVVGLEYHSHLPWQAAAEIRGALESLTADCGAVTLVANSIGAYFCMCAGIDKLVRRSYFISPIVDMECLITGMMEKAGVTESELETRGHISTPFGEELSWEYLCYVRDHPVHWTAPAEILYGSRDELTDYETILAFAQAGSRRLTVMEGGEHWFHTEAQLAFLDRWIIQSSDPVPVNGAEYHLLRLLGKGKGGYSYLAEQGEGKLVLKQIHHEPCDYYSFGNKIEAERSDYQRLCAAEIPVPGMLDIDPDTERIVKQYIPGPTVMELLQAGASAEPYLPQVRSMAARAAAAGLNIDYYPTNFVVADGVLWYVDYECNTYMEQWDFEHWGIRHWMPRSEEG